MNCAGDSIQPLFSVENRAARAAVFISGEGSNAVKLLESKAYGDKWQAAVIVSDRPETSNAADIAARFGLPFAGLDIKKFYESHGEKRVSLMTPAGREIRELWTERLRKMIAPFKVDFGILAGFVPLTNISSDFPCLNIHPGDLLYLKEGSRYLVGLHKIPVERAILEGLDTLRSSVIIAQTYSGGGEGMDSGPVLAVSVPVKIDLNGYTLETLRSVAAERESLGGKRVAGDILSEVAAANLEQLKRQGDWTTFPPAVEAFASGRYGTDGHGGFFFYDAGEWLAIRTVEFSSDGTYRLMR
jgi:folate-dependent phosphoribosylglycinamide formyltransferase PurN